MASGRATDAAGLVPSSVALSLPIMLSYGQTRETCVAHVVVKVVGHPSRSRGRAVPKHHTTEGSQRRLHLEPTIGGSGFIPTLPS